MITSNLKKQSFWGEGFNSDTIGHHETNRCAQRSWINAMLCGIFLFFWYSVGWDYHSSEFFALCCSVCFGLLNLHYISHLKKNKPQVFYLNFFLISDILTMTFAVIAFPQQIAFLSPLMLFTCMGIGLRYGKVLMYWNVLIALIMFLGGTYFSTYWRSNISFAVSIFLMVSCVPLYFGYLMKKVEEGNSALIKIAKTDLLTNLGNRRYLMEQLEYRITNQNRANSSKEKIAIFYFDLDNFKKINDTLGHHIGDLFLQKIAHNISSQILNSDLLVRLGGDEFVLVANMLETKELDACNTIAQKIQEAVLLAKSELCSDIPVTTSIGALIYNKNKQEGYSIEKLLSLADSLLYVSKSSGKNRCTISD